MNWMKYRFVYFLISGIFICFSIFSLVKWGFNLSIDFTGGVVSEYKYNDGTTKIFKFNDLSEEEIVKERIKNKENATELRFEVVGPSIGMESIKKTIYALIIAAVLILLWVAIQFKNIKFGISAIIAMLHDSLILIGVFSAFGHFFSAEIDFLFVTALLTILSFSVHDTIVVYDRIREKQKKTSITRNVDRIIDVANVAVTETMTRSLNNSFTIIFMLLSLVLLGGDTIKWFAIALLVGTIFGTYSSPFVAVPILVTWDEIEKKFKK